VGRTVVLLKENEYAQIAPRRVAYSTAYRICRECADSRLDVQNMTCELCPITVKKALGKVPGVADAKIDLGKKTATVTFDPDKPTSPRWSRPRPMRDFLLRRTSELRWRRSFSTPS